MRKRKFPILLTLGISLVVFSLLLVILLQVFTCIGADKSQKVVARMNELFPNRIAGVPETYSYTNMPLLEIDGVDYVALVEIPSLNLSLPVTDTWDSNKLYNSPSRFFGSCYDNTLVIGGDDNPKQFSFCDKVDNGTAITVTDMTGTQFSYNVSRVDRSKSAESSWLLSREFDLTLFCRDVYSMEYVAVRCNIVND